MDPVGDIGDRGARIERDGLRIHRATVLEADPDQSGQVPDRVAERLQGRLVQHRDGDTGETGNGASDRIDRTRIGLVGIESIARTAGFSMPASATSVRTTSSSDGSAPARAQ